MKRRKIRFYNQESNVSVTPIMTTFSRKLNSVKNAVRSVYWGFALFAVLLPRQTFAAACPPNKLCNPITDDNLTSFFLRIVNTVIQYGALLIVLFIVFAGFKFVTAQGNSEKLSEAKKMLTWIVVGAFVLLGVYVIRAAICGTIGQLGVDAKC